MAGFEANLTKNAAYDTNPAFSPDGKKIAFESSRDGNSEVYVMDTDSGTNDAKNLSNNQDVDGTPDWSPDGSKIAFSSNRADNYNIFVMNADGSSQKRLTKVINNPDLYPAWSPNGKKIAFMSTRGGGDQEIFTMKAKPEGERNRPKNLTKDDDNVQDYLPDWQPLVN